MGNRIEDLFNFGDRGEEPQKPQRPDFLTARPGPPSTMEDEVGATRMIFFDELTPGMVFVSPHRCNGRNCGLSATTHTKNKFHECSVTRVRSEGQFVTAIYEDENGVQQS